MSRLERQLRSVNPRTLYTKKRRNSAEPMLLNSLAATEGMLMSAAVHNNNNNSNHGNNIIIQNSTGMNHKHKSQSPDVESRGQQVPNNVASAKGRPHQHQPNKHPRQPSGSRQAPSDAMDGPGQSHHLLSPNNVSINTHHSTSQPHLSTDAHRSVIVNLSLTGNNLDDKRRLSKVLREINEMREIRDRQDSYASEASLEANILKTEELEMQRITKLQRSKRLLFKYKMYDFLKRPASVAAMIYHIFAFILVAACLILSIYPSFENEIDKMPILDILENAVLFWFTAEFILMLWACECRPPYQGWRGKLAFMKSPAHLIDLLVIILSAVLPYLSAHDGHEVFAFRAFRGFHRFFQLLQVIALKRQLRPWQLFYSVLYDQREQLLIIFYLEIVLLCLMSYLAFLVEHEANKSLENIADAMWWSVVTLTTVGYGDKTPVTWMGKVISGFFILFGVAVFALPAGIIGAGLALKLEEVERSRQRRLKKEAAATLIQRAWKTFQANHAYMELSLFFRHQPGDLFKVRVYDHVMKAFIATVKFHVSKNCFKELTRPVDLRNVIESYKYGQSDIFARLKQLNQALDIIISRTAEAENDRVVAINQLAKRLEDLEMSNCSNGGQRGDGDTRSLDNDMASSSNFGGTMRYLDPVYLPPMPQTSTHPSGIPLRSRPQSSTSHIQHGGSFSGSSYHHNSHHHIYHQQQPATTSTAPSQYRPNSSTPNYYYPPFRQPASRGQSDHTITTIDEVALNDAGEEIANNSSSQLNRDAANRTGRFNSDVANVKTIADDNGTPNHPNSPTTNVKHQHRRMERRNSR